MKLFVALLFVVVAVNAIEEFAYPPCYKSCTKEMKPVCAKNNNDEYRAFNNKCELSNAQCYEENEGWVLVSKGVCPQAEHLLLCMRYCTLEHKPVCGINNKGEFRTFGNECQLLNEQCSSPSAGWKQHSLGECLPSCFRKCTKELRPVCATNSAFQFKTFNNECELENEQCLHVDAGVVKYMDGKCPEEPLPCIRACTMDYRPICARNSQYVRKTLSNNCALLNLQCYDPNAEWVKQRDGECQRFVACARFCTAEYAPVCGKNNENEYQTFSNNCMFINKQCSDRDAGWIIFQNGECPAQPIINEPIINEPLLV